MRTYNMIIMYDYGYITACYDMYYVDHKQYIINLCVCMYICMCGAVVVMCMIICITQFYSTRDVNFFIMFYSVQIDD
jgi:hypothetical protein